MSKVGRGCVQPVKGTIALDQETIDALCACMTSAVGIELSVVSVGCTRDVNGDVDGSVFLCVEKTEDGVTTTTVLKHIAYADGTVTSPFTGAFGPCDAVMLPVPLALETVCMNVDGNPQPVTPIITVDMATNTVLQTAYVDDFGAAIVGVVTPADACDCECVECGLIEACIRMEGFDYYALTDYVAGQTTPFGVSLDGNNIATLALDYTVESDGTGKASWYAQVVAAVSGAAGWTMTLVTDADEATNARPVWEFNYSGTDPSTLVITENADVRTIDVDAAGTVTATALDGGNPFGTDPFSACA